MSGEQSRIRLANFAKPRKRGAQRKNQNARRRWTARTERAIEELSVAKAKRPSRRSINDKRFMLRAAEILRESDRPLFDSLEPHRMSLSHLGRIQDPLKMLVAAKAIRNSGLNERQARRLCQRVRIVGGEIVFRRGIKGQSKPVAPAANTSEKRL